MITRCPICKRGVMNECVFGAWCSRMYAKRSPCRFEAPFCDSRKQYREYVVRWREKHGK